MVVLLGSAPAAAASPASVALDDRAPSLSAAGSGWTTTLGFTNLTGEKQTVTALQGDVSDCDLHLGDSPGQSGAELRPAEHADVKVTATSGCLNASKVLGFSVTAGGTSFSIEAKEKAKSTPDWVQLRAFAYALIAMLICAIVFWSLWDVRDTKIDRPWQPLPYLEDSWSFKESWVSNAGITAPPQADPLEPPLSETMFAATMIVAALDSGANGSKVNAVIRALREANVKPELPALKANPEVDSEKLDVVVDELQRASRTACACWWRGGRCVSMTPRRKRRWRTSTPSVWVPP
jgi:hypothetical protein